MKLNKGLVLSAFVLATFMLANCSPKVSKPVASTPVTPATPKPEIHYTEAQIAQGQAIYTSNCGKCHKLHAPTDRSLSKWEQILPTMIRKAKLTDEQGGLVRAYVMANLK
jgi:mono/diheme cytochrome c family protein